MGSTLQDLADDDVAVSIGTGTLPAYSEVGGAAALAFSTGGGARVQYPADFFDLDTLANSDFALAVWARISAAQTSYRSVMGRSSGGTAATQYGLVLGNDGTDLAQWIYGGALRGTAGYITLDAWHQLGLVVTDIGGGQTRVVQYVDGAAVSSVSIATPTMPSAAGISTEIGRMGSLTGAVCAVSRVVMQTPEPDGRSLARMIGLDWALNAAAFGRA